MMYNRVTRPQWHSDLWLKISRIAHAFMGEGTFLKAGLGGSSLAGAGLLHMSLWLRLRPVGQHSHLALIEKAEAPADTLASGSEQAHLPCFVLLIKVNHTTKPQLQG